MTRNDCKKVLIVNGNGGNSSLLPYFAQTQLDKPHYYVVYVFDEHTPQQGAPAKKTRIALPVSRAPTRHAKRFPKRSTPEFGGTPVSRITIPAKAQRRRKNSANSR